ncbi:hypothetical protein [Fictibacillus sp. 26RED30]|uniref:hypothetical protein n=1 Tax=Fictibacillus sp. 26RED30 TaxID=2745877 RepID=UPI0018CF5ED5|nr:hypothetical protein [Fictibacillus sp. 26RED30]MBH0160096.1 hypothetical protein [Fictibacillus sp. 26RED30]
MFEYWIYDLVDEQLLIQTLQSSKDKNTDQRLLWYFQSKNVFVVQSTVPFGDGNFTLDELLVTLSDHYEIHDKGIIKSHWHASGLVT